MTTPYNFETPNWVPLERAIADAKLPRDTIREFMWMCEQPRGVHQYKHIHTHSYVYLNEYFTPKEGLRVLAAVKAGAPQPT
jgi:hypothetical protein